MARPDVGTRVIDFVHQHLQIDEEWTVRGERGFAWWAGPLAQSVWAEPPYEDRGAILSRMHVRTDLLRGLTAGEAAGELAAVMELATQGGLVRADDERGVFRIASSFYLHEQVEPTLRLVVSLAAALQTAEAHRLAPGLAGLTSAEPDESAPTGRGRRSVPDSILKVIETVVAPAGAAPPAFEDSEFEEAAELLTAQGFVANPGPTGLTAEFPFGEMTSLLTMRTDEPHPVLGNGVRTRLTLPVLPSPEPTAENVEAALRMNAAEVTDPTQTHFNGSWHPGPRGLTYTSFFPNVLRSCRGWVTNLVQVATLRARWAAGVFEESFDPEVSFGARMSWLSEVATLSDDEFAAMLQSLPVPPGAERDKMIATMTAMRNSLRKE